MNYSPLASSKKSVAASSFKDVATDEDMATCTLLDCLHLSVVKLLQGAGMSAVGTP